MEAWSCATDEEGNDYFYNEVTYENSWTAPDGFPPSRAWVEKLDADSAATYYLNLVSGESSWEKPAGFGGGAAASASKRPTTPGEEATSSSDDSSDVDLAATPAPEPAPAAAAPAAAAAAAAAGAAPAATAEAESALSPDEVKEAEWKESKFGHGDHRKAVVKGLAKVLGVDGGGDKKAAGRRHNVDGEEGSFGQGDHRKKMVAGLAHVLHVDGAAKEAEGHTDRSHVGQQLDAKRQKAATHDVAEEAKLVALRRETTAKREAQLKEDAEANAGQTANLALLLQPDPDDVVAKVVAEVAEKKADEAAQAEAGGAWSDSVIAGASDAAESEAKENKAEVIPAGWTKVYDEECECEYYVNSTTGETEWECPEGIPEPPAAKLDSSSSMAQAEQFRSIMRKAKMTPEMRAKFKDAKKRQSAQSDSPWVEVRYNVLRFWFSCSIWFDFRWYYDWIIHLLYFHLLLLFL